jgi:hypothetical protein
MTTPWLPLLPRVTLLMTDRQSEPLFLRFCDANGLHARAVGCGGGLYAVGGAELHAKDVEAVVNTAIENVKRRLDELYEGRVQPGTLDPAQREAILAHTLRRLEEAREQG